MMRRTAVLRTFAVGAMIVALGGAAFGADSLMNAANTDAAQTDSGAAAAEHATIHIDLPAVVASVVDALTGGSNPSTTVATRGVANEHANANATTHADAATNGANNVSSGQQVGQTGTAGTRPGFGCGDTNHAHSGPPGRPGASLPPGCAKR
jgi:hypothetical protein